MKISASKKQLARIISENGGWRDGAEWAAQDKLAWGSDNLIVLYTNEPSEPKAWGKYWTGKDLGINSSIISNELLTNWYQTKINRDEYFHLYPAPDADGWVEYCGTERPLGVFAEIIDVRLYDGRVLTDFAGRFEWNTDGNARIVAYRLSKQEQAKSNAVGDDETSLAAKEELEALEFSESPEQRAKLAKIYAPSIEQLAADYRNLLDFALRKQQEADDAKSDADARLKALVLAGEALGLIVSPITAKQEPELEITDWRDLKVGDEVECVDYEDKYRFGVVISIDEHGEEQCVEVSNHNGDVSWPSKWRFIRRP